MKIIFETKNSDGAYSAIQSWGGETPPDGWYEVADGVTLTDGGFGTLTLTDNIVSAFTGDPAAWEAWQAAQNAANAAVIKITQIAAMKAELDSTDYQIIKSSECSLANLDAPYDIAALHTARQAIRDQINALQATLTDTGTTT